MQSTKRGRPKEKEWYDLPKGLLGRVIIICKHVRNTKNVPDLAFRNSLVMDVTGISTDTWRRNRISKRTLDIAAKKLGMEPEKLLGYLQMESPALRQTLEQHDATTTLASTLVTTLNQIYAIKPLEGDTQCQNAIWKVLKTRSHNCEPYVFYRWRQLNQSGLHWVDVYFLAVLSVMKRHGFQPQALITDTVPPSLFAGCLIKKLTGSAPITLTKAQEHRLDYEKFFKMKYAPGSNIDNYLLLRPIDTSIWLQFIPWWVDKCGRKGYAKLVWNNTDYSDGIDRHLYGFRHDVQEAFIKTDDIYLGDKLAKKDGPDISIGPDGIDRFVSWLSSSSPPQQVHDLGGHLEEIERLCQHSIPSHGLTWPAQATKQRIIDTFASGTNKELIDAAVKAGGILEWLSQK